MILQADGSAYKAPLILDLDEVAVIQKTLGMTPRNGFKPVRGDYRWGVLKPDSTVALRLNGMQEKKLINLMIDGSALSKKDLKRFKAGDYSKAALVSKVTHWGIECYKATLMQVVEAKAKARAAEAQKA